MKSWLLCLLMFTCANSLQAQDLYIYFDFDSAEVHDSTWRQVVQWIFKTNPQSVSIEGHCDSVGDKSYNYQLSKRRCESVRKILIANTINPNQIISNIGFGKDRPLNDNSNEFYRQLNRRVRLSVINKKNDTKPQDSGQFKKVNFQEDPKQNNLTKQIEVKIFDKPIKLKKGDSLQLPDIHFLAARHIITSDSYPTLLQVLNLLKENPTVKVEIQGHVCCVPIGEDGADIDFNDYHLSEHRARAIYQYLVKNGIAAARLTPKGYKGDYKLFPNEYTQKERSANRRVVFVITDL